MQQSILVLSYCAPTILLAFVLLLFLFSCDLLQVFNCQMLNFVSLYLQFNLRVGIIGVAYLIGMSTYTLGSIVVGLLTDILVSEYLLCGECKCFGRLYM